jgi:hypothetical protein
MLNGNISWVWVENGVNKGLIQIEHQKLLLWALFNKFKFTFEFRKSYTLFLDELLRWPFQVVNRVVKASIKSHNKLLELLMIRMIPSQKPSIWMMIVRHWFKKILFALLFIRIFLALGFFQLIFVFELTLCGIYIVQVFRSLVNHPVQVL